MNTIQHITDIYPVLNNWRPALDSEVDIASDWIQIQKEENYAGMSAGSIKSCLWDDTGEHLRTSSVTVAMSLSGWQLKESGCQIVVR